MTDQDPIGEQSRFNLADSARILRMNLRLILICAAAAFLTAAVGTALTTRQYKATALLQLVPASAQEMDVGEGVDMDVRGFQEVERYYRTQLQLIGTRTLALEVIRRYREMGYDDLDQDTGAGKLGSMLTVFPRERSQLIEISITHPDPERAAVLATLVAEVYVDQNLESRREASRAAKDWLELKIAEYEEKVSRAQVEILTYKRDFGLIDVDERVTALSARMGEVDEKFGKVATDRVVLASQIASYERMLTAKKYAELAEVLATPTLQSLSRMYAEARTDHASIAARYGEKHSKFTESEERLSRIVSELRRETRQAVEADQARLAMLEAQETTLTTEIEATRSELLVKQERKSEYDSLVLELERNEGFLKRLAKRSDELDLSSSTQLNNAQIREGALPPTRAFKPNVLLNLALGLFAGAMAGVSIAFLRHYIDDTVTTPADISTYVGLPFLGMIPKVPDEHAGGSLDLYTVENPQSMVAEAARGLRTILELNNRQGRPLKKLLITSSVASEGKTSTCLRIGIAVAQFGKRVLVIDADHRRARIHKVFGIANDTGLLSTLQGHSTIDQAVKPTSVGNLFAMPLGPRSESASQLLAGARMERLLDELSQRFDLLIIDTPPAATLTEAINLSKMVDGVLLVVRSRSVSRAIVRHTVDRFRQVDAEFLGAVLNNVDVMPTGAYGYLYGYRYYPYYYSSYYGPGPEDAGGGEDDDKGAGAVAK